MTDFKISIRQSSGEQFEVTVPSTATVAELKAACVEGCKLAADAQRLIFKGKLEKYIMES